LDAFKAFGRTEHDIFVHKIQVQFRYTVEYAYNNFSYNDASSSVPAELLSFMCIQDQLHYHFTSSNAFSISTEYFVCL